MKASELINQLSSLIADPVIGDLDVIICTGAKIYMVTAAWPDTPTEARRINPNENEVWEPFISLDIDHIKDHEKYIPHRLHPCGKCEGVIEYKAEDIDENSQLTCTNCGSKQNPCAIVHR